MPGAVGCSRRTIRKLEQQHEPALARLRGRLRQAAPVHAVPQGSIRKPQRPAERPSEFRAARTSSLQREDRDQGEWRTPDHYQTAIHADEVERPVETEPGEEPESARQELGELG